MSNEAVAQSEQAAAEPAQQPEVPQQDDKEKNFAALRESKEKLEKENREYKEYFERLKAEETKRAEEQSLSAGLEDDDDFVNVRQLKELKKEVLELRKNQESIVTAQVPDKLQQRFKDFKEVVTEENLQKLRKEEPEIFETLKSGSNLYNAGVGAYKNVKAMLERNMQKPRSVQSISGQGGLSDANMFANDLTSEGKQTLIEQMAKYAEQY